MFDIRRRKKKKSPRLDIRSHVTLMVRLACRRASLYPTKNVKKERKRVIEKWDPCARSLIYCHIFQFWVLRHVNQCYYFYFLLLFFIHIQLPENDKLGSVASVSKGPSIDSYILNQILSTKFHRDKHKTEYEILNSFF